MPVDISRDPGDGANAQFGSRPEKISDDQIELAVEDVERAASRARYMDLEKLAQFSDDPLACSKRIAAA